MIIKYKDKKLETRCTNFREANKTYNKRVAEALYFTINYIENAKTLMDVKNYRPFNLHPLYKDRKGTFAIDLAGRRSGFRLIIKPLDKNGEEWQEADINKIYKSTQIVILLEVTNHYE